MRKIILIDCMSDFFDQNQAVWNDRVETHLNSKFYDMATWKAGRNSVPQADMDLLGAVSGKSLLHLQCHFGQDTLSLGRLGAKVTGVDFSSAAIDQARALATELNLDAKFVCCNVLDIGTQLNGQYDLIYTSYGTIGWLPRLDIWAQNIARFLRPGGAFVIVDFHPMLWSLNFETMKVGYSYFNTGVMEEEAVGSYVDEDKETAPVHKEYFWNHPFTDIVSPLVQNGLQLTHFEEYDFSPWPCFEKIEEVETGKWKFSDREYEIPMVYGMRFIKPA